MKGMFIAVAIVAAATPALAQRLPPMAKSDPKAYRAKFFACKGPLEFKVDPNTSVTFEARQHRDEVPRLTVSSEKYPYWIDDPLDALLNTDKNYHPFVPKDPSLYVARRQGFCIRASGWWQWGNGPDNHQSYVRIEAHRLSPTEALVTFYIDNSNDEDADLKIHFRPGAAPGR